MSPNSPLPRDEAARVLRRILIGITIMGALLFVAVWWSGYSGRVDTRRQQVMGCLRGTADRLADVKAYRKSAHSNFLVGTDPSLSARTRNARLQESDAQTAAAQEKLTRTSYTLEGQRAFCERAYPYPPLFRLP